MALKRLNNQQNSQRQRSSVILLLYTKRDTCKDMDKRGREQTVCNYREQIQREIVSEKREYVNE